MKRRIHWLMPVLLGACATTGEPTHPSKTQAAGVHAVSNLSSSFPDNRPAAVVDEIFGQQVADPFRWLEAGEAAEVKAWAEAQDAWSAPQLKAVPGHDTLSQRFRELFYIDAVSAPHQRGDRAFYTRRFKDQEKAIVFVREADGQERVLLDPNAWSEDGSVALGGWYPSPEGRYVAYKVQENNADEAVMKIRDVATGEDLEDHLDGMKYARAAWLPDESAFYYVYLPPVGGEITVDNRPGFAEVRYHALGVPQVEDPQIYPSTQSPKTFLGVNVSRDGRWLFLTVQHGWNQSEVFYRDLSLPVKPDEGAAQAEGRVTQEALARGFKPLFTGHDATAYITAHEGAFYLYTNLEAPNFRVFRVAPDKPERSAWKEIIPEGDKPIDSLVLAGGHFLVQTLDKASSRLEIRDLEGGQVREIALPGIGTVTGLVGQPDSDEVYYVFTSFTSPPETYHYDLKSGESSLWAKVDIPVDTSLFDVKQVFYPSKDGTEVSMFIVAPKGVTLDGSHPTLLYGYGGFNVNMTPAFSSAVAVWLEQGGIYAVPNLRGGGEYGEDWHRDGMLHKKQNVFDDYIAAAEYLIAEGYTRPDKLAIRGGSNGGLLVGAAMTQRPELYAAVICAVPLLDMVRYHLYGSGRTWIPEYGSPEEEEDFEVLYAYSPYHHVKAGADYPALLMLGADNDDRVDPMHARKFTAAVQEATRGASDAKPALFRLERNAGHGGGDMVKTLIDYYADQYAFLAWQLGMEIR